MIFKFCQLYSHQIIHVGFAGRVDVLQELQQVEGVPVHQMDSYSQIWLVLKQEKKSHRENV